MKNWKTFSIFCVLATLTAVVCGQVAGTNYENYRGSFATLNANNATIHGTLGVTGATTLGTANVTTLGVSGVTTLGTANITAANITTLTSVSTAMHLTGNFTADAAEIRTVSTATLTSPATTVSVASKRFIVVTPNAALSATLVGGTTGQIVTIIGTSDTHTVTLTDGTSYTLAGTLAMGAGDAMTLLCTAGGTHINSYLELSRSVN